MTRQEFRAIANEICPSRYLDYREWLQATYQHVKATLKSYSYSRFAEDMGFSAGNVLHHVIKGRRPLTKDAADKIIGALQPENTERSYLRQLVAYNNSKQETVRQAALQKLFTIKDQQVSSQTDKLTLQFFRSWYHPVIAELVRLEGFRSDPQWISRTLNGMVRVDEVQESLDLLERMQLIEFDKAKGRHIRTSLNPSTAPQVSGLAVASFHSQMINNARDSIVKVDKKERDISSLTLAIDAESLAQIKDVIYRFQSEILAIEASSQQPNRIVQLNFQLFPLSRPMETAEDQDDDNTVPKSA